MRRAKKTRILISISDSGLSVLPSEKIAGLPKMTLFTLYLGNSAFLLGERSAT
jgi:hypothetical protein